MASDVLKADIAGLLGKVGNRKTIEVSAPLEELANTATAVPPEEPVHLKGVLEAIEGNRIVLEATLQTLWTSECRRCLTPLNGSVETRLREIFELAATEGETYPIDGSRADLERVVREAVMLELPDAALCRADCQGLCPSCGINRNESECGCKTDITDPRWAALGEIEYD